MGDLFTKPDNEAYNPGLKINTKPLCSRLAFVFVAFLILLGRYLSKEYGTVNLTLSLDYAFMGVLAIYAMIELFSADNHKDN